MKAVSTTEFRYVIANDFNINLWVNTKIYFTSFPIVDGKRKINCRSNCVIVDKDGIEHPYMIDENRRNEEKLLDFDHLLLRREKTLNEVLEDVGFCVEIEVEKCRVSEGGGWYSFGAKYTYKNIYCEK